MEKVRTGIRNLFWMMKDESGGLCRRSPEAIAEILISVPTLIGEYGHLLPSYLWEEPFERGIRFAIFRLAWKQPQSIDLFYPYLNQLEKSLQHDDKQIQGYAFLALHLMKAKSKNSDCSGIDIPSVSVPFYDFTTGELENRSLAYICNEVLGILES